MYTILRDNKASYYNIPRVLLYRTLREMLCGNVSAADTRRKIYYNKGNITFRGRVIIIAYDYYFSIEIGPKCVLYYGESIILNVSQLILFYSSYVLRISSAYRYVVIIFFVSYINNYNIRSISVTRILTLPVTPRRCLSVLFRLAVISCSIYVSPAQPPIIILRYFGCYTRAARIKISALIRVIFHGDSLFIYVQIFSVILSNVVL